MDDSTVLIFSLGLGVGILLGLIASMAYNKLKTGSTSANQIKQQQAKYQADVEAHFEETSRRFKAMTEQYQEFYQHLSKGATDLCRPEFQSKLLLDPKLKSASEPKRVNKADVVAPAKTVQSEPKAADPNPNTAVKGDTNKAPAQKVSDSTDSKADEEPKKSSKFSPV